MRKRTTQNIVCLILAASAGLFTGGCKSNSKARGSHIGPPTSTFGTLPFPVAGALSNPQTTGCFPKSEGWDKYVVIPNYFVGPGYTTPTANCYLNPDNYTKVIVSTCNTTNGAQLETGIQIQYEYGPQDKVCATNTASCAENPRLTIDQRTMESRKRYRATIFFKSATAAGVPTIAVDWRYQQ